MDVTARKYIPRDVRIITLTRLSPKPFSYLNSTHLYFHRPQENKYAEVVWETPFRLLVRQPFSIARTDEKLQHSQDIIMGHKIVFLET